MDESFRSDIPYNVIGLSRNTAIMTYDYMSLSLQTAIMIYDHFLTSADEIEKTRHPKKTKQVS